MADYREISQEYAKGAIKAAVILNSGALIAVVSQIEFLTSGVFASTSACAARLWIAGIIIGVFGWVSGFFSARFVDRSERAAGHKADSEMWKANIWQHLGVGAVLISLLLFAAGAWSITSAF